MSTKTHWEKIYKEKSPKEVSWTQETPVTSIEFFEEFKLSKTSPIIDVGGGESRFVDYLINEGYQNISVLDISKNAIDKTKERVGEKSKNINWIVCDINQFKPKKKYVLWHDRAVFHFLTSENDIKNYVKKVKEYSENFVVGAFSTLGPKKCSGLNVSQYDEITFRKLFEDKNTSINKVEYVNHTTPFETTQNFIFCSMSFK